MTGRSTAGVGFDPPRWFPQLGADDQVSPAMYCAAAGLARHFDPGAGVAGGPVSSIARTVGQHPDRTRGHLRGLVDLGWLDLLRPASRGRGRFALYLLTQPSLVARNALPGGHFGQRKTPSEEGVSSSENTLLGGRFGSKTPSEEGYFETSLLIPVGGWDGMGWTRARPKPADLAAADEVIAQFPARLIPWSESARAEVRGFIAEKIAEGWRPREVLDVACSQLPRGDISAPLALLEHRFKGRPVPSHGRPASRTEAWRTEVASGPDPDRIRAGAAAARAAIRGAS